MWSSAILSSVAIIDDSDSAGAAEATGTDAGSSSSGGSPLHCTTADG